MQLRVCAAIVLAVSMVSGVASAEDEASPAPSTDQPAPAAPPAAPAAPAEEPPPKESNVDVRVFGEVAGYQDSVAVSVLTPSVGARIDNPVSGWGANGRYLVDVVSAASPDIVSTASPRWSETRHAGNVGAKYKPGDFGVSIGGAASYTPDYLALNGNAQLTQDLDEKNWTLALGYGYGHDVIGRVGTPWSVFSRTLDYHSFTLGASRVVSPSVVVGLFADGIVERGDQSKPYRYIPMFDAATSQRLKPGASVDEVASSRIQARPLEQLPLERERAAVTGRLAWRFTTSTLRLEERVYADTWGLTASTTDARWFFDVTPRVMIWPHVRAHLQNGVSFWERTYIATSATDLPAIRTGDRELSPLSSGGLGGGIRLGLGKAGRVDDFVLQATLDGVYTAFHDALYVKERFAGLFATSVEVAF